MFKSYYFQEYAYFLKKKIIYKKYEKYMYFILINQHI